MRRKFQQFIIIFECNHSSCAQLELDSIFKNISNLERYNSTFNVMVNEEVAIYWHIKTSKPVKLKIGHFCPFVMVCQILSFPVLSTELKLIGRC